MIPVPYLVSLLTIVVAAAVLLVLVVRLAGRARQFARTTRLVHADFTDHTGLLTARIAALKVDLDRRRHRRGTAPRDTPTIRHAHHQTRHRPGRGTVPMPQTRSIDSREVKGVSE